ncbi:MAG: hypothetical protein KF871_03710 [Hydrogenophaga sp.]|uniref:hypothetical protein n=1 Tax=Hydrogenophaga sp. TaxID=1904254 RepID=UPI001DFC76B0|nr:hypothetical protein [Hydrogenophaga sp.]MBX3608978.1 hypothetical protein [Hydrogenophaga sp.]
MASTQGKDTFEYCALRYLHQWLRKEQTHYLRVRQVEPKLDYLRAALSYFMIARNFRGLDKEPRARVVRGKLLEVRAQSGLSVEQKVSALARFYEKAGFRYNVSAASKLLWLSNRKPIIYDARAFDALRDVFGHEGRRGDYGAYCKSWKKAYKENKQAILDAAIRLPKIRAFLPADAPDDDRLLALVQRPWFTERVFDIYLWELGGDD